MTDIRDILKQEDVISPIYERLEQIAALKQLTFSDQMRETLVAAATATAALNEPTHLTEMQKAVAAMKQPAYTDQMRETLAGAAVAVAELSEPTYLAKVQKAAAALKQPIYIDQMRETLAAAAALKQLTFTEQMREALTAPLMQSKLAEGLSSYQELISKSALASFLVSTVLNEAPSSPVAEVAGNESLGIGDYWHLEVVNQDSVDQEIMDAVSEGKIETLSPTAMQRLQSLYLQIVAVWDFFLRIVQTYLAYELLVALLSSTSMPADIPAQVALLPNEQRELLADYRVVNRDGARLRAEPTTQSKVIASLTFAMPVEVIEYNDKGWYHVVAETSDGLLKGWMYVSVTTPIPKPKYPRGYNSDTDID